MLCKSREEALCLDVQDLSSGEPPYAREDILAYLAAAMEDIPQLFEWRARRKDGSLFWAEVSMRSAPLADGKRLVVLVRDISERKKFEEVLRLKEFPVENMPRPRNLWCPRPFPPAVHSCW
ncbi:MAG TPA: PAS domain S-box protein [Geobacteraceae bacterium]|nr:PAS domain S-box protein [Geobacteraceae bacterium]